MIRSRKNCSLLGTDNVRGQVSVHFFSPNGCATNLSFKCKGDLKNVILARIVKWNWHKEIKKSYSFRSQNLTPRGGSSNTQFSQNTVHLSFTSLVVLPPLTPGFTLIFIESKVISRLCITLIIWLSALLPLSAPSQLNAPYKFGFHSHFKKRSSLFCFDESTIKGNVDQPWSNIL